MSKRKSKRLEAKRASEAVDSPDESNDGQQSLPPVEAIKHEVDENVKPQDQLPTSTPQAPSSCKPEESSFEGAPAAMTQNEGRLVPPETEPVPVFHSIDQNVYLFDRKKTRGRKEIKRMLCDCILTKDERRRGVLGCGDDCLNRMLMIECSSRCTLGDNCANRRFQKKQYAKVEPFRAGKKGWGLRALERIEMGSFIMEYVGEVVDPDSFRSRVKKYDRDGQEHYYFMALKSDEIIDATMKGNITRFINHSCEPNIETQKWTVNGELRVGFFATETLEAGDEVTLDYQFQRYGKEAQKCYCEKPSCRGFIGATEESTIDIDGSRMSTKQRRRVASIDAKLRKDHFEDLALEAEIEKLVSIGFLKNKTQTMMLARVMVRADDNADRAKLLDVINSTKEHVFLRLFLDYHGLQLLWSWMVDTEDPVLRVAILQVLSILPVPNRTVLKDSRVWETVEKWAANEDCNPPTLPCSKETSPKEDCLSQAGTTDSQSPKADSSSQSSVQLAADEKIPDESDTMPVDVKEEVLPSTDNTANHTEAIEKEQVTDPTVNNLEASVKIPTEEELLLTNVSYWAHKLLEQWKELKEGFKIPRLLRQNREAHEKEAENWSMEESRPFNDSTKRLPEPEPATNIFLRKKKKPNTQEQVTQENGQWAAQQPFDWTPQPTPRVDKETFRLKFEKDVMKQEYEEKIALLQTQLEQLQRTKVPSEPQECLLPQSDPFGFPPLSIPFNPCIPPPSLIPSESMEYDEALDGNVLPEVDEYQEDFMAPEEPDNQIASFTVDNTSNILIECTSPSHELLSDEKAVIQTDYGVELTRAKLKNFLKPSSLFNEAFPPPGTYFECMFNDTSYYVPPIITDMNEPIDFQGSIVKTPLPDLSFMTRGIVGPLPKNWRRHTDSKHRQYLYNRKTGAVRWTMPPGSGVAPKKKIPVPTETKQIGDRVVASADSTSTPPIANPSRSASPSEASPPGIFAIGEGCIRKISPGELPRKTKRGFYDSKRREDLAEFKVAVSEFVKKLLTSYRKPDCQMGRITSTDDFKFLARKLTNEVYEKETNSGKAELTLNEVVRSKATTYIKKYMAKKGKVFRRNPSPITSNNVCQPDEETASIASN